MEGDHLDFFVTYKDHQAIITLSEYDTVEQLKIEIANNFDIPVMDQVISGWHLRPDCDDMILQSCSKPSNDVNCLFVNNLNSAVNDFSYGNENLVNNEMDTESNMSNSNIEMELEATKCLKRKLSTIPLKIQDVSFQEAISNIADKKKALLLYLHNSKDVFSQNFMVYAYDDQIADILETSFFIVGWDIENESHHRALLSALEPFASLSIISHIITEKTSAAVCLILNNNEPVIFSCLRGNLSHENVLERLKSLQEHVSLTEKTFEADPPMEGQEKFSQECETKAIESLRKKVPSNTSITFRYCTLDDAIKFICTSSFDERKALLLYLHNSEHPFSKMFTENLGKGEIPQILNRSFLVLGWDVEEPKYHDALVNALCRHVNLSVIADLVTNKVSVGLCILPMSGSISLFMCLRGNISLRETIKSLKAVEKVLKEEIIKEKELKALEDEKSNENDLGSEKLHSIWADLLGDRDYDSFEYDQHNFLKEKIGYALKGPPQKENGYDEKTNTEIEKLYDVIKTESNDIAEFKDKIEISFIYNCLEPLPKEKVKRGKKFGDYNPQTDVNPVPIFVLRRCRGSDNPCRVFIDDTGRVYQNWRGYVTKNKFPECEMVVPLNGRYEVVNNKVLLEKHLSAACHLDTKLLQVGDIVSTAAGLASGAVFITAAVIPTITVAPPLLIAAVVVGAGAGIWAIGRSAYTLIDRKMHKETMSFANSEARGAYINIVAGSLGFAGAGANMALSQLARSGANIGQGATYFVNTIGILNIGAGGASLANSGYDVFDQWYNENQTPSALTILQLGTSVLFFGHAVYSFKGAQTIVDETQARVLKDYNDSLRSNRHRKTFDKLMKETLRTHNDGARGRAEVISAIRNIQNKDEVFAALTRNNKAMNRAGIRFSAEGGQIKLGGIAVDMNEFMSFNKKQTKTFLGNLPQQQPSRTTTTASTTTTNDSSFKGAVRNILSDIQVDTSGANFAQLISLTTEILMFCSGDIRTKVVNAVHQAIRYVLDNLAKPIAEEIDQIIPKYSQFFEFLNLGISFFSRKVQEWEEQYQAYERTKDPRYFDPLFEHVNPLYAKRAVTFFELVVRNSYSGESLTKAVLMEISGFVTAWVTKVIFENEEKKECEQRRMRHSAGIRVKKIPMSSQEGLTKVKHNLSDRLSLVYGSVFPKPGTCSSQAQALEGKINQSVSSKYATIQVIWNFRKMEGDRFVFSVTYKDYSRTIFLSEYDTVGQLKIDIDKAFGIPVMDQTIIGWHMLPESDDMILKFCLNKSNYEYDLTVIDSGLITTFSLFDKDSINNQIIIDTNGSDEETEVEASLKEKLTEIPFKISGLCLQDIITDISFSCKRKALLLYLHNLEDLFSQNFLAYAYDDDVANILKKSFRIVCWDIEDSSCHETLQSALDPFPSMSVISSFITRKKSAAICLIIDKKCTPVIFSFLKGDMIYKDVLETLQNMERQLNSIDE